ncbi:MAG: hypothetical protein EOP06_01100 [Proteobacteria bacterium]|nr:MAG: hypothetical protein EOP06_01100 [Pseudomonadota bacterium]
MTQLKSVKSTIVLYEKIKEELSESPSPGILNTHNLDSSIFDVTDQGIDLSWEEATEEAKEEARLELVSQGFDEHSDDFEERHERLTEEKIEELSDNWEGGSTWLVGDWKLNPEGKYDVNHEGEHGWAGTYSNQMGATLTVEWSRWVARCHHTSPCYVRADTGGRCGDLDTPGEMCAYTVPAEYF